MHSPGKADLRTHWLERSSHSRSGSPPGSGDPSVKATKTLRVQRGFSLSTDGRRDENSGRWLREGNIIKPAAGAQSNMMMVPFSEHRL